MVPLTADLAPPESRSKAISITLSGLMLGVLVARVLSGIIAEFADWRYVYWMSVGLQYLIFIMLWWTLPDYPAKVANVGYWQVVSNPDCAPISSTESDVTAVPALKHGHLPVQISHPGSVLLDRLFLFGQVEAIMSKWK